MASSSPQRYELAHDDELHSSHSVAHKNAQSSEVRHSYAICSAESPPRKNTLTNTDDEATSENVSADRAPPRSNTFPTREENESFQRVQPSGPFFSVTNSVYDFPASAALEPGTRREVLEESSQESTTRNIKVEKKREHHAASPVSEEEQSDQGQSSRDEAEEADKSTKSLGQILRNVLSDVGTGSALPTASSVPSPDAPLPTAVVLQALKQALEMTGESGNVPAATTNMLSEALAKPVKTAKDARARRGAIMRYKRAAEAAPSTAAQSREKSGTSAQSVGCKRKLSEEEIEEKRIKNRASVQACRHRKRVRKSELEAEQGHYAAENSALRGVVWCLDYQVSGITLSPETEQLHVEAKADLSTHRSPDAEMVELE